MHLSNLEKETLGFLYGRIGSRAKATMPLRELQNHFAEVSVGDFWQLSAGLIEKDLISNKVDDEVSFTPAGWKIAHALQGRPEIRDPRQPNSGQEAPPPKEHLVWDLSRLGDYEKAQRFVMGFRQSLCVYSAPVEQLYTNYDLVLPKDNSRKLIIMPNQHAHHDTFSHLNADAVVSTGVYITPTPEGTLQLMLPLKSGRWHKMALDRGLNFFQQQLGASIPFLPVLTKGDLRELTPSQPVLHLHRIILSKVLNHSELEIRSIRRAIQGSLTEHFGFNPDGLVATEKSAG